MGSVIKTLPDEVLLHKRARDSGDRIAYLHASIRSVSTDQRRLFPRDHSSAFHDRLVKWRAADGKLAQDMRKKRPSGKLWDRSIYNELIE